MYEPNWGMLQTANENMAPKGGRPIRSQLELIVTNPEELFSPPHFILLPLLKHLHADGIFWLNARMAALPLTLAPPFWLFWCGRETMADSWKKPSGGDYL